jgi:molecular chaperone GrpE
VNQKDTEVTENPETTYTEDENAQEHVQEAQGVEELNDVEEPSLETSGEQDEEPEVEYVEKAKFDEAEKQAEENHQRYLRAQADLDNFRRRTRLEKEESAKYASIKLLEQLLPVVDNFERALAASQTNADFDSLAKGIDMVFRQISQVLEQEGLKPIQAVGEPFNPEFHQAIMQVESEEYEEGIVVEEVQKGYFIKDKVLRPAMVKVSQ